MTSLVRRIFLNNNQSVYILNGLYKSQPCTKFYRQNHLFHMKCLPIVGIRITAPIQIMPKRFNSLVYTPVRFKSNKRNRNKGSSKNDDDSDNEDDDNESNLDDYREGDASDRNLARIKVQTLRLDTVIKAGLGIPKSQVEKLFYDSKLRVNGRKITKKSMDITNHCEIDVIKGNSTENNNFLLVSRIEVLSVKAEGLYFIMNIRRHKNLTIEDYADSGRSIESADS